MGRESSGVELRQLALEFRSGLCSAPHLVPRLQRAVAGQQGFTNDVDLYLVPYKSL